ncbi:MAG: ATPase, T2SS/T4P/T4SS family [Candidatus Baltobacteraceae bacterium]
MSVTLNGDRTVAILRSYLGPHICRFLEEPDVIDILVRPGWIAVERAGCDLSLVPSAVGSVKIPEVLRLLAPLVGRELARDSEIVELQLPGYRARFAGLFHGERGQESFFTIRRMVVRGLDLDEYVRRGVFPKAVADLLVDLLRNPIIGILIAGQTGSGKTTFLASLLQHVVREQGEREHLVIIEDTAELLIEGPMVTSVVSTENLSYRDALRAALRHRPTRLVVGEARGGEALDAVKAGATGHGLLLTIHANTAEGAVRTLLARMAEGAEGRVDEQLVCEAIRLIAVFRREGVEYKLVELCHLRGISYPHIDLDRLSLF